jgi:hypothetical protein
MACSAGSRTIAPRPQPQPTTRRSPLSIPARVLVAADYTLSVESVRMRDPNAPPRITLEYRLRGPSAATASPR